MFNDEWVSWPSSPVKISFILLFVLETYCRYCHIRSGVLTLKRFGLAGSCMQPLSWERQSMLQEMYSIKSRRVWWPSAALDGRSKGLHIGMEPCWKAVLAEEGRSKERKKRQGVLRALRLKKSTGRQVKVEKDRSTLRERQQERREDSFHKKAARQLNWRAGICAGLIIIE